jgi:hypothetical protein
MKTLHLALSAADVAWGLGTVAVTVVVAAAGGYGAGTALSWDEWMVFAAGLATGAVAAAFLLAVWWLCRQLHRLYPGSDT